MRTIRKPNLLFFACLLVIGSCDIVSDDKEPAHIAATMYAFAGKPALINVAAISAGEELIAKGTFQSTFGKFETILDGRYILYTPTQGFSGKTDEALLDLANSQNRTVKTLRLEARSLDGSPECNQVTGVYDYARIRNDSSLVIDLLDNDVFCGVGYNGGVMGEVAFEGVQSEDFVLSLGPGRQATFNYKPKPGFTGKIKVIYNLGINWLDGSSGASYEEVLKNPKKYLEAFTTAMVEIDVE